MNKYKCTFNRSGEVIVMETEAMTHNQATLNCLAIMAKRYGVKKDSLIRYFKPEKLNNSVELIQ
ncbi:MAG: hypothetical protein PHW03_05450 [Eubacteriales bacterium]|nr:hypothetical protein [Eubacteriales bacterium]